MGGERTKLQRQGLVSLGGQSSALGAGSTGVGSAPLGQQGQQAGGPTGGREEAQYGHRQSSGAQACPGTDRSTHVNLELRRKVGIHVAEKRGPREGSVTSTPSRSALRQRAVAHTP